jgi:hypothetical protein
MPERAGFHNEEDVDLVLSQMQNVIEAYCARADSLRHPIRYTQGMNLMVSAILLVVRDPEQSFWIFAVLVEEVLLLPFFSLKPMLFGLHIDTSVWEELLRESCPKLVEAIGVENFGCLAQMLAMKWFVCCFVDVLPFGSLLLLWDELLTPSASSDGTGGARRKPKQTSSWKAQTNRMARRVPMFQLALTLVSLLEEGIAGSGPDVPDLVTTFLMVMEEAEGFTGMAKVMNHPTALVAAPISADSISSSGSGGSGRFRREERERKEQKLEEYAQLHRIHTRDVNDNLQSSSLLASMTHFDALDLQQVQSIVYPQYYPYYPLDLQQVSGLQV